jgi:hypothetical protein
LATEFSFDAPDGPNAFAGRPTTDTLLAEATMTAGEALRAANDGRAAYERAAQMYPDNLIMYCHGARVIEKTGELPPIELRSETRDERP